MPARKMTRGPRGGARQGAGRPAGTTKYGEPTKVIRIPESAEATVLDFLSAFKARKLVPAPSPVATAPNISPSSRAPAWPEDVSFPDLAAPEFDLPLYAHAVPAGMPAMADDSVDMRIDLNRFLVRNPVSTFYFRVSGDSMNRAGILDGMTAAVDCSKLPRNHDPVLAVVDGDFTVKRYVKCQGGFELHPDSDNPRHQPIVPSGEHTMEVRGVIIGTIQKFN